VKKTNAARLLDQAGVAYELRDYEVGAEHLPAAVVAERIGLSPEQVFKTLVARGERHGVCFAVVPANASVNLKALAKLRGERKVELVPLARVTLTALAAKKDYPVCLDETAELFGTLAVSAGVRGLQIVLDPADYVRVTSAVVGPIGMEQGG
jgi:Cys-tRNA(Pro)/Cys-tRNA(Cys) deacylase